MKKTFLFVLAGTALSLSACGQKLKESAVPAAVKQAFSSKSPGVTGTWEKENGDYEVNFKKVGKSMSQVITAQGLITETETDIPVSELSEKIRTYLLQHYKGAKVKEAAKIEKSDGKILFEAEVNGKDVLFDAEGNFVKEAKD
ncbi:MAG TPA: PepSY-like domain-containing protein [Chryseolinea sp.]|nr:PepSY-like domain-containing protein [Chryseolinea sp.]